MSEVDDLVRQGLTTTPALPGPGGVKGGTPAVPARPDNPIHLLNYQQMMQMPAPAWLIEGILPERALTLMFGASNSFKSFLAVDMACHIATGLDWHGQTAKQGSVVYIAAEGAYSLARQRIVGWADYHGVIPDKLYLIPLGLTLDNQKTLQHLQAKIDALSETPVLLVSDVLAGTIDGSDSEIEVIQRRLIGTRQLIERYQLAELMITHSGWSQKARARGSTHLWGSADTRLGVVRKGQAYATTLTVERHKDAESGASFGFSLKPHAFGDADYQNTLIPIIKGGTKLEAEHLSPRAEQTYKLLLKTIDKAGVQLPATRQRPACKAVRQDVFKAAFWASEIVASDKPDSKKKACKRCLGLLENSSLIRVIDDFIELAGQPDKVRQIRTEHLLSSAAVPDRQGHTPKECPVVSSPDMQPLSSSEDGQLTFLND